MRTSSVFAIFCLSVGITSSSGYNPRFNAQHLPAQHLPAQHLPAQHLPSIKEFPEAHREQLLSIKKQWDEQNDALRTRFKALPPIWTSDHLLAFDQHLVATEQLRDHLEALDKIAPFSEGRDWLKGMHEQRNSMRKPHDEAYNYVQWAKYSRPHW